MMADILFKAVKAELPKCNTLPQQAKDILNTANNSLNDLDQNDAKDLWVLLYDCIKETSVLKDAIPDIELLKSYQCVLNLVHCAILCTEEMSCIFQDEHLINSIMIFQRFYSLNVKKKFKLEIIQMYLSFWKLFNQHENGTIYEEIDKIKTQNMIFTVDYLCCTIESTIIKSDMDTYSLILWELWNLTRIILPLDQPMLDLFLLNLEKHLLNCKMYLKTLTGKLTFANVFTINTELILRFQMLIKDNIIPNSNKAVVGLYSEICFIAWKISDATTREVIEQHVLSPIISTAIILRRQGAAFVICRKVLVFLQCLLKHRTDIRFSKVITQLYESILWRYLTHEYPSIRCNANDILAKVYPLEKPYTISATFLIKQQDALLNALNDSCHQIEVSAIQDDEVYVSTMHLAALIPISKLTVHISAPSTALSTLKQLPNDMKKLDNINENLPDCPIHVLSMWNQSYKIIQLVTIWFKRAFKTLNLNETLTFKTKEENVFETNLEECKPKIGIILITSILTNQKSLQKLMDSGINQHYVHEMILCLENIKPAIENRMLLDGVLNDLLTDEVMIELLNVYLKLHIVYYHYDNSLRNNKILNHQMSVFDWIIEKLLVKDLQCKTKRTKIFIAGIIKVVNAVAYNCSSMKIGTRVYLNKLFIMCSSVIDNHLGNWILLHVVKTLGVGLKHLNYLEVTDHAGNDRSTLNNCVAAITSIILFFEDYKSNKKVFKRCIGEPEEFHKEFSNLILELQKLSKPDFHKVFSTFIETIMVINDNEIRKINTVDITETSIIKPFSASQLMTAIFYDVQLERYFSDHIVELFLPCIYENDSIRLLSAVNFIFNITVYASEQVINFLPVISVLFKRLGNLENYDLLSAFYSGDSNLDMSIFNPSHRSNANQKGSERRP